MKQSFITALREWRNRNHYPTSHLLTALIDMDGVLYDSMKYHTLAWQKMMEELGIPSTRDEFYTYEGMTGTATINLLLERAGLPPVSEDRAREIYAIKKKYFLELGHKEPMPGADLMLKVLMDNNINRVLVTGSAQSTLIDALAEDYPGAFSSELKVTALDVKHGKPNPEPYLMGLRKSKTSSHQAIVIENAPLGVKAGVASGCFTIAVTTGPIKKTSFEDAGADLIFTSMPEFANYLPLLITCFNDE
ncbi:MAG: HAD hydrolase-like protein [Prevotella sp.]|nr:HAD hydrolase-like protein [Bacteroides sp.]MCM1366055.1 HAD hydrolase-like protein [Prevotella sp.]MCM1436875.1 HAD hydrolase-like protein [Prevotella sp.]